MWDNIFASVAHVTLHDGQLLNYTKNDLEADMYENILALFPKTMKKDGSEVIFNDRHYLIFTDYMAGEGMTKIYIRLKNPSWAKAHLLTCGYSRTDYKEFEKISDGRIGQKHDIARPPLPYLVSRVEPGIIMDKSCLLWLTPFARCIAWAALDPRNYKYFLKEKQDG